MTCCLRSFSDTEPGYGNGRDATVHVRRRAERLLRGALAGPPGHHEETATGLSAFDPPAVVTATFDGYSATVHGSSWVHGVSSGCMTSTVAVCAPRANPADP